MVETFSFSIATLDLPAAEASLGRHFLEDETRPCCWESLILAAVAGEAVDALVSTVVLVNPSNLSA